MSQGLTFPATSHTSVCSPTCTGVLRIHDDARTLMFAWLHETWALRVLWPICNPSASAAINLTSRKGTLLTHLVQYVCFFHSQDSRIYFPFCSTLVGTNYFSGLCEFSADQSQKAFVVFSHMSLSVTHFVHKLHGSHTARLADSICLQPLFWYTEMLLK